MKIYLLPVSDYLQPPTQGFIWPPGCDDYGVEQDWLRWLRGSGMLVDNPARADWHYLPVFWNRWYLTHAEDKRAKDPTLQEHIDRALIRPRQTFTICEYDPFGLQPGIDLHGVTVFSANRMTGAVIDIPLLLHPHDLPPRDVARRAVFVGHLDTHPIRRQMQQALDGCRDCLVTNEPHGIDAYVRELRGALLALCPRGDGAQSFRFYEAMQAGVAPLYLSDIDARPFRRWIDWDACSLYRDTVDGLCEYVHSFAADELLALGERAAAVYRERLQYGQWCEYVIKELEALW